MVDGAYTTSGGKLNPLQKPLNPWFFIIVDKMSNTFLYLEILSKPSTMRVFLT
jgi:hypothetical protein